MKFRWLVFISWVALTMTLSANWTFAHHSASATYIHGKSVKIEGTLKEFIWRNPHSFMKVQAPDEKGEMQIWVIEGAAPAELNEQGLKSNSLRPGDRVIVTGQPGRIAEDHRILLESVQRPSDGFKWQGPAAATR